MEGRDRYSIDFSGSLTRKYQQCISALYLPLIGKKASCLYLLMIGELKYYTYATMERLCALTHLDINELEEAIILLEQYELLRTYKKGNDYLFVLRSPLDFRDFFHHQVYGRLYMSKVGRQQYELTQNIYCTRESDLSAYEDITHGFDRSVLDLWTDSDEKDYREVRPAPAQQPASDFDFTAFFRNATALGFPISLRSRENLDKIADLAVTFAIRPEVMYQIVCRSTDYKQGVINWDSMRRRCLTEKSVAAGKDDDGYDDNPVSFLYRKQGGVPVSSADKKMLEYLQKDLGLNREVVNVLIEHTLEATDNQLNRSYVEKVATTWVRQKIETAEQAREAISRTSVPVTNRRRKKFEASEMEIGDQDIQQLRRQMFGDRENNDG